MKYPLGALVLTTLMLTTAQAQEYTQVHTEASHIRFNYTQMGVTMRGGFSEFTGELRFDPAEPEQAYVMIDVDLVSIDTGIREADAEVTKSEWLHTAEFPTARFESDAVTALGEQNYEVSGRLTIKGQTRDISVPATFSAANGVGIFIGDFSINRSDFAIGEGVWASFDMVANAVDVEFQLTATVDD